MGGNAIQSLANVTPLKRAGSIQIQNVGQVFRTSGAGVVALSDVSLDIKPGRFVVLVGPSGCGKSTLLMMLAGLRQQTSGTILVNGAPIPAPDPNRVGVVFQEASLFPWLTALDNIAFPLTLRRAPRAERHERAATMLDLVGLTGFERQYPYQLSGGMQQRVGLVRALAVNPSILLMDEPFAALDAQTREILQDELLQLMQRPDERKTMVFITHSIDEAILLGDRIAVMSARPGRIKEILDVPLARPRDGNALRADPHFAALRAHIWNELRTQPQVEAA